MAAQIVLFEDQFLADMNPITLTRPAFAVTCACWTLAQLAATVCDRVHHVVRGHLKKTAARGFPSPPWDGGPALFLNASIVPDVRYAARMRQLAEEARPFICTCGHRVAAAFVPAGALGTGAGPAALAAEEVTPRLLELKLDLLDDECFSTLDRQYQVITHLERLFPANIAARLAAGGYREVRPGVHAADGVSIAETSVLRAHDGPIVLERGVEVMDFAYFAGPVHVGAGTRIIERTSVKEAVSIGERCKIGGEIEASVIEGFTNKQHHGFLGHSYVGSWVNLGAGTSNSDLKNSYGEVRLEFHHAKVDTGLQFLGAVIGDFAKSAINTSIFTGKVIGVSSMLYGFIGQNVPSFCNYARSFGQITECPLDQAVLIQKRMFARRGVAQTPEDIEVLRAAFELTHGERLISDEPPSL
jgi:UDP-N-acetylglucosamine diphosphorylase / glucose-1-phosphate thymidylyltransferase / UDP-N-acetylgalactosamine diphosphorylase / glucosamine-1-phosphate N-acetyltransferase / galactosamine-1-phosphate N-acetyltransferase